MGIEDCPGLERVGERKEKKHSPRNEPTSALYQTAIGLKDLGEQYPDIWQAADMICHYVGEAFNLDVRRLFTRTDNRYKGAIGFQMFAEEEWEVNDVVHRVQDYITFTFGVGTTHLFVQKTRKDKLWTEGGKTSNVQMP
jgi:hypothetical protein